MTKLESLRLRYVRDPVPVRLGGLAANLARIASFSKNAAHRDAVLSIFLESKWFIEWTAAELEIEKSAELVIDRKVLCDAEASHSNKHKSLFISTNMLNFGVQKFSFATFRSITN